MKYVILTALCALIAGFAVADGKANLISTKIDEWFAEARPATQLVWLKDSKGCLHSAFDDGAGIKLVAVLGADKKPICRK